MLEEILIAGFGGQGILSTGQLLAHAGMDEGKYVAWIPSYGPEMRGGTANCGVTVSDAPISSPLVTEPTCLIAMNQPSLDAFAASVVPDGLIIINSSLVECGKVRSGVRVLAIPATARAEELGSSRVAANVLLGACIAVTGAISLTSAVAALGKVLPPHRHNLILINRSALEQGCSLAREQIEGGMDIG